MTTDTRDTHSPMLGARPSVPLRTTRRVQTPDWRPSNVQKQLSRCDFLQSQHGADLGSVGDDQAREDHADHTHQFDQDVEARAGRVLERVADGIADEVRPMRLASRCRATVPRDFEEGRSCFN